MGNRLFLSVLWIFLCVYIINIIPIIAQKGYSVCEIPGCNCTVKVNPWKSVNCNLNDVEHTKLTEKIINEEIVEMSINGGNIIEFSTKTFNSLPGLSLLHINGTKKIVIDRKSFYNLTYSSLLIEIKNCDQLIIKTGAFDNMGGHVDVEITNTGYVAIEKSAFTKLRTSVFKNIRKIILAEGTFEIKGQGNTKRHGPFTTILFEDSYIPKVPSEAFYSSLADITFKNTKIDVIESKAFHTNEIAAVSIIRTYIGKLERGAFTDRTLISTFKISICNISKIESEAIMAGITNLTVNHSTLTDIENRAIVSTIARAEIIGNFIGNFHSTSFLFYNWNRIQIEENIIKKLYKNFIEAPINDQLGIDILFTFKGNEINYIEDGGLNFVQKFEQNKNILLFDDNLFHHLCECSINDWFEKITNNSRNIDHLMETSYCFVNNLLAQCFNLTKDPMNIKQFLQKVCNNETKCEQTEDDIEQFNQTHDLWPTNQHTNNVNRNWLGLIITFIAILLITIVTTFTVLIVRGSRWLKRKGYFRNIQYNRNEHSLDDENTIVTMDENEKLEMPEELTLEFLQLLSKKLDDPQTHQEASEMIERLYEAFIVDDSYGNNNRQEDDAHLYEELNNLNLQIPPPPYEEQPQQQQQQQQPQPQKPTSQTINGPRSILKLMEEKVHLNGDENERPQLNGDYSEPSDAAVHLYSELKQQQQQQQSVNETNKDSLKSNSSRMAFRPLPDKPLIESLFEAGPSTKI